MELLYKEFMDLEERFKNDFFLKSLNPKYLSKKQDNKEDILIRTKEILDLYLCEEETKDFERCLRKLLIEDISLPDMPEIIIDNNVNEQTQIEKDNVGIENIFSGKLDNQDELGKF